MTLGVRGLAVPPTCASPGTSSSSQAAAEAFGAGRLDILVNNAGGLVRRSPLAEVTPELLEETMRLNFFGATVACRAIIPGMAARGYGRVVNIGSVAAHTGNATNHHYAAAKAALTSLGRSLTKEFAHAGVTINTVAPGLIDNAFHVVHTPRPVFEEMARGIPAGRAGTDEDIAAAVAFLVSEGCRLHQRRDAARQRRPLRQLNDGLRSPGCRSSSSERAVTIAAPRAVSTDRRRLRVGRRQLHLPARAEAPRRQREGRRPRSAR